MPNIRIGNSSFFTASSATDTIVTFKVPAWTDSIPGKVRLSVNGIDVFTSENFVLTPPVITGISPSAITAGGTDIIINGTGFNPTLSYSKVFWDIYPMTIKSSTVSQIVATLPVNMSRNNGRINVKTGGYTRSFPATNEIKSYWSHTAMPSNISWVPLDYAYECGTAFSMNGKGYMVDNNTGSMISFDPSTKSFTSLGNHTILRSYGLSAAVCKDTAYMIGYNFGLHRYNASTNTWISTGAPGPVSESKYNGAFFCLNDKLYYGLNFTNNYPSNNSLNLSFWMYNPVSNNWIQKKSLPPITSNGVVAYFSINNKGYVLFYDNKFCEYDPGTDTWRQLTDYPGTPYYFGRIAFVIDGKAYAGAGRDRYYSSVCSNDLYTFDPNSNTWSLFCKIPFSGRYNSVAFVINNKGYIMSGKYGMEQIKDLLEFDPNYIMK
jgi:hypothetical protein